MFPVFALAAALSVLQPGDTLPTKAAAPPADQTDRPLDTSIARLDDRELLFLMGHEMGHYVLGHAPIIRRSASASNSATAIIRGGKARRCATGLDSGAERVRHESDPFGALRRARNAIEERHHSGFEGILRADDQKSIALD